MSNISRIIVEVEGSDWINKVIYEPDSGRQEIVTIKTPTNPILHQVPRDVFYALQFNMGDFYDKDGNESVGAAVSYFLKTHTEYSLNATSNWADELVADLNPAQISALRESLAVDDIG